MVTVQSYSEPTEKIRFNWGNFSSFSKHLNFKSLDDLYGKEVEVFYENGQFYILLAHENPEDLRTAPYVFKTKQALNLKNATPVFSPSYSSYLFSIKGILQKYDSLPAPSNYFVCMVNPYNLTTKNPTVMVHRSILPIESVKIFQMDLCNLEILPKNKEPEIYAWIYSERDTGDY